MIISLITWIDDSKNLLENTNFLVSSKNFSLYHSAYVELENYNCPQDYNRIDIYEAEEKVEKSCFNYSEEDVNFLTSIRLDTIANSFRDSVKKR